MEFAIKSSVQLTFAGVSPVAHALVGRWRRCQLWRDGRDRVPSGELTARCGGRSMTGRRPWRDASHACASIGTCWIQPAPSAFQRRLVYWNFCRSITNRVDVETVLAGTVSIVHLVTLCVPFIHHCGTTLWYNCGTTVVQHCGTTVQTVYFRIK